MFDPRTIINLLLNIISGEECRGLEVMIPFGRSGTYKEVSTACGLSLIEFHDLRCK